MGSSYPRWAVDYPSAELDERGASHQNPDEQRVSDVIRSGCARCRRAGAPISLRCHSVRVTTEHYKIDAKVSRGISE
jgi:hypothetical protein